MSPMNSPSPSVAGGARTSLAATGTERHPEAQALHLASQGHPPRMRPGHLVPGPCPPIEIAQHLRIRIELDLQVEMPAGQRDQQQAGCPQNRLRHPATITDRTPGRDLISAHTGYPGAGLEQQFSDPALPRMSVSGQDCRGEGCRG